MNQLVPGRIVLIQELVAGGSATTAMSGTIVCVKEHPTVMYINKDDYAILCKTVDPEPC